MYVRVVSDAVSALAPQLLADYRYPFTGTAGADIPIGFGGFVIAFSETGCCIAEEAEDHVKQLIAWGQRFLSPASLKTKAEADVAELKARVAEPEGNPAVKLAENLLPAQAQAVLKIMGEVVAAIGTAVSHVTGPEAPPGRTPRPSRAASSRSNSSTQKARPSWRQPGGRAFFACPERGNPGLQTGGRARAAGNPGSRRFRWRSLRDARAVLIPSAAAGRAAAAPGRLGEVADQLDDRKGEQPGHADGDQRAESELGGGQLAGRPGVSVIHSVPYAAHGMPVQKTAGSAAALLAAAAGRWQPQGAARRATALRGWRPARAALFALPGKGKPRHPPLRVPGPGPPGIQWPAVSRAMRGARAVHGALCVGPGGPARGPRASCPPVPRPSARRCTPTTCGRLPG
jgi:hypothetical protein